MRKWLLVPVILVVVFGFVPTEKVPDYRRVSIDGSPLKPRIGWCDPFNPHSCDDPNEKIVDKSGLRIAIEGRLKWLGVI